MKVPTLCLRLIANVAATVAATMLACPAAAQTYPGKLVRVVVPYVSGGVVDVMGRILAERVSASWGQQVIVEQKPGANGMIGTEFVLNSAPDGYTWLLASTAVLANAAIYPDLRWEPARDFSGAAVFARAPIFFVVPASLPVKDLREYVELARSQPGKLDYGNPGNGTTPHLSFELFKRTAGIDVQPVPYKGSAPILPDLIAGRLSATLLPTVLTTSQAKSGTLKVLAVLNAQRARAFPDVPTLAETGYPEAQIASWYGVMLPARTPRDIVRRVAEEIEKVVKTPEMIDRLDKAGGEATFLGADEFDAQVRRDGVLLKRIIREAGIKPQ